MKPRKMNLGGTQSWPPDTEDLTQVARQDNTYVTAPQLNFLANQLLPAQVPSNIEAEMLNRHGVPAVSTQPPKYPSLEYVRTSRIMGINRSINERNREIAALVEKGYGETTAKSMVEKYHQDMRDQNKFQPGTAQSIAPLIDLTPVGDVLAMAGAVGQALEGDVLGAGATGGLALATIFTPASVPTHAQADDLLRLSASSLATRGVVPENVVDIIEYIQEVATPGNISFGARRSRALGRGARTWREPMITTTEDRGTGVMMSSRYLREAIDRPYSNTTMGIGQTLQSGRSVGNAISTSGSRATDADLEATAELLENFVSQQGDNLNDFQQSYYEGIIQSMRENLQGGAQRGVGEGRPSSRPLSVQAQRDAFGRRGGGTGITPEPGQARASNQGPGSTGTIGRIGDEDVFNFRMFGEDEVGPEPGNYGTLFSARAQMAKVTASGTRNSQGTIDYTFFLQGDNYKFSDQYKRRVKSLVDGGMNSDAAKQVADKEFTTSLDQVLRKMYGSIPVGSNIAEKSYSTDSYPMFLHGLRSGKYKTIGDVDVNIMGGTVPRTDIDMRALNTMGASNKLFRKFSSNEIPENIITKLEENTNWNNDVGRIMREKYSKLDPEVARKKAEKDAVLNTLKGYSISGELRRYGIRDEDTAFKEAFVRVFKNHIDGVIKETNDQSIDALIRHELQTNKELTPMQAEIKVMNYFIPLPETEIVSGVIQVPVPRAQKIRAEEGAFLSNFTVKKKGKKGMRIKKGA